MAILYPKNFRPEMSIVIGLPRPMLCIGLAMTIYLMFYLRSHLFLDNLYMNFINSVCFLTLFTGIRSSRLV
jgi:hypothetical protein